MLISRSSQILTRNGSPRRVVNSKQLHDFQFSSASGNLELDSFADLFTEQRSPDGRRSRNFSFGHVGFLAGDELVGDLFVFIDIEHRYRRSQADAVARDAGKINHRQFAETSAKLPQ